MVSRSVYTGDASALSIGQRLPPICPATAVCGTATAADNGAYPNVFKNNKVDGSFWDHRSSKSDLALNLSTHVSLIPFMAYTAPVNILDVSKSNTPGVYNPTNPVGTGFFRAVAQVGANGNIQVTDTNAYSGSSGGSSNR